MSFITFLNKLSDSWTLVSLTFICGGRTYRSKKKLLLTVIVTIG